MSKYPKNIRSGNIVVTLYYYPKNGVFKIGYYKGNGSDSERVLESGQGTEKEALEAAHKFAANLESGKQSDSKDEIKDLMASAYTPDKPMRVEEVVTSFLSLKDTLTSIGKPGGGIIDDTYTNNDFAGRLLLLRFRGRYIHSVTKAEFKQYYAELANGEVDISSIYRPGSNHCLKKGEKPSEITVISWFRRMNSVFVHAQDLRALREGLNPCWASLKGKELNQKTSQRPYSAEALEKIFPLLERDAPQLVRGVVFVLEGGRICELAKLVTEDGKTKYLYLTMAHVNFGFTVDQYGNRVRVPTGSIEVSKALAKSGPKPGRRRFILITAFGKRFFHKYRDCGEVIIPLRWVKKNGQWIQKPIRFDRALSKFVKEHEKELKDLGMLDFSFTRNGFRHSGGSVRPVLEGRAKSAKSFGHDVKISKDYYDDRIAPTEAVRVLTIRPLPGKPVPFPPLYGADKMRRELATRRPSRGGYVPLVDSAPLLVEFKELYEKTCGTSHGWAKRLSQLLGCADSNVTHWWHSCQGTRETERAPSKCYVDKLRALLADKEALALQLDRRTALLAETARRIEAIRPFFDDLQPPEPCLATWLARQLPPTLVQVTFDWVNGRRYASETHLARLDALLERLKAQGSGPEQMTEAA